MPATSRPVLAAPVARTLGGVVAVPTGSELRRRLPRLAPGLLVVGFGLALMVHARLGLGPWEVLHQGISVRTGIPIGASGILVGFFVLIAWIPLRNRLGVGTLLNVVVVGLAIDASVWLLPRPEPAELALRISYLAAGVLLCALGSGLYIGAGLGAGPRDGLMTALAERGWGSIRLVRTVMELSALGAGWLLGGDVGIGTVVFALGIGPLVQVALDRLSVRPLADPVLATPAE